LVVGGHARSERSCRRAFGAATLFYFLFDKQNFSIQGLKSSMDVHCSEKSSRTCAEVLALSPRVGDDGRPVRAPALQACPCRDALLFQRGGFESLGASWSGYEMPREGKKTGRSTGARWSALAVPASCHTHGSTGTERRKQDARNCTALCAHPPTYQTKVGAIKAAAFSVAALPQPVDRKVGRRAQPVKWHAQYPRCRRGADDAARPPAAHRREHRAHQ